METVEFSTVQNPASFDADPESGVIEPETEPAKPLEMTARQQNYSEKAPVSARGAIVRAFQRVGGRSNAIRAKCLACCNFDRDEIRHCTVETCPLHSFRPFQPKTA